MYESTDYKDIKKIKTVLGQDLCQCLPFVHAFTGCDTTSRIFGIRLQWRKLQHQHCFVRQANYFWMQTLGKPQLSMLVNMLWLNCMVECKMNNWTFYDSEDLPKKLWHPTLKFSFIHCHQPLMQLDFIV